MDDFKIVITDDDEEDFLIMKEAFEDLKLTHTLIHKQDGNKLLTYLKDCQRFGAKYPDLVLLDINMPKLNGVEVLELIKKEFKYRHIPVVMYSTSSCPDQKKQCMDLGAQAFVSKPSQFKKVVAFVKRLDSFFKDSAAMPGLFADVKEKQNILKKIVN